jgi:ABC-2 type transport system ATP-binding protein
LTSPRLVFLDEPTRGLDPIMTREFREILLELNRQGSTIFINSHILSEVESVCNRVAIMRRGRVLVQNEMSQLLSTDSDTYAVECDRAANLPAWFTAGGLTSRGISGAVPRDRIHEFFDFAHQAGIRVYECVLGRASLEEAFLRILQEGAEDDQTPLDQHQG